MAQNQSKAPEDKPTTLAVDPSAFAKLLRGALTFLGGTAALFMVLGYLIVQSYVADTRLYGIADFPLQFYKEATISFVRDGIGFFGGKPYLLALALTVVALPLLYCVPRVRKALAPKVVQERGEAFGVVGILVILVLTWRLGGIREGYAGLSDEGAILVRETVLYCLALPGLAASVLYLIYSFRGLDLEVLTRSAYGAVLGLSGVLLLSIPIAYGSALFDLNVYPVGAVTLDDKKLPEDVREHLSGKPKVFYMMGHTSDRELFFDAATRPARPMVIAKDLVLTIEFLGTIDKPVKLRTLFKIPKEEGPAPDGTRPISKEDSKWAQYIK